MNTSQAQQSFCEPKPQADCVCPDECCDCWGTKSRCVCVARRAKPEVILTVYLRGNRVLSGKYTRLGAALRLRFARVLEDFMGYKTEALS